MLHGSRDVLFAHFDLVMFDLDGVVYVGEDAVPYASASIEQVRAGGVPVSFITNNASRPPDAVSQKLQQVGVTASLEEIVTSAQAVAHLLVEEFGSGARVAVLGGAGLSQAVQEVGLHAASVHDEDVQAVVSGYGPQVPWEDIMRAAVRIKDGVPYFASNTDGTIPTSFGVAPGHGVLVELLSNFARVLPTVAGKPARPLFDEALARRVARRPVMVGDRLDTDIEGAAAAGIPSLLVLTGVTGIVELLAATPAQRPTYLASDLRGLTIPHPEVEREGSGCRVGGWSSEVVDGRLRVSGQGENDDWWRAAAVAGWAHLDDTGEPASYDGSLPS